MSLISYVEGKATLGIPFRCKCPYCGALIQKEKIAYGENTVAKGGVFLDAEKPFASMLAESGANYRLRMDVQYAIARLEHYRRTVAEGKLMNYFKTGKAKQEDWFTVEKGSELEGYLSQKLGKTSEQYGYDRSRLSDFPYRWLNYGDLTVRDKIVKCPQCNKRQPWCYDTSCKNIRPWALLIALLLFVALVVPFPAFLSDVLNSEKYPSLHLFILGGATAISLAVGILFYRLRKKRRLKMLSELDWSLENVPEFDPAFLEAWNDPDKLKSYLESKA